MKIIDNEQMHPSIPFTSIGITNAIQSQRAVINQQGVKLKSMGPPKEELVKDLY